MAILLGETLGKLPFIDSSTPKNIVFCYPSRCFAKDLLTRASISYGAFFMSQLLTAPHIIESPRYSSELVFNRTLEDLGSGRFTIRDTDKGLNMDFLSYSNYILVDKDATALLDHKILLKYSEKTLQTFFKHFAATAKWTYDYDDSSAAYADFSVEYEVGFYSSEKANGTASKHVEVLTMNKVATWLSLTIVFLLMIILIVLIVSLQIVYPRTSMLRQVECLADVLAMVAGSDKLIRLINEVGVEGMEKIGVETRLGWFRDKRGNVRWGVEIVEQGGVEWMDGPGNEEEEENRVR
jgi:hypothetical protein